MSSNSQMDMDCSTGADAADNKFKKMVSLPGRTGSARLRRGPNVKGP